MPDDITTPSGARRFHFWMLIAAAVLLIPVAIIGAVLSYTAQYEAVAHIFGEGFGRIFPLQVDLFIAGASLAYIASALVGRPRQGWRLAAHVGVLLTLILNALTAQSAGDILWHLVPPAAWAACVELTAHHVLGEWRVAHEQPRDRIPMRLWISAPVESVRTWLIMSRLDLKCHAEARAHVGLHAAAREALREALPRRKGRRVRRVLKRQLRAGSLTPAQILAPLGWTRPEVVGERLVPTEILRQTLIGVLAPEPAVRQPTPPAGKRRGRPSLAQPVAEISDSQASAAGAEVAAALDGATAPATVGQPGRSGLVAVPRQAPAAQEVRSRPSPLTVDLAGHRPSAVPETAWDWWCKQRAAGLLPNERDWEMATDAARSTAGRWRRASEAAEAELVEASQARSDGMSQVPVAVS